MTRKTKKQSFPYEKLASHPLSELLMENLQTVFPTIDRLAMQAAQDRTMREGPLRPESPLTISRRGTLESLFTDEQNYHLEVFAHVGNVLTAVERLCDIQTYISRFPQPRAYGKQGITEDKWIHFHYSNYLTTVVSIYDTALLLVNAVFRLGLEPKVCSNETVIENRWVRRTSVKSAIRKLDDITKSYRRPRNLYVHRGQTPKLAILELLETFSFLRRVGKPTTDIELLNSAYGMARTKLAAALEKETGNLSMALMTVFDSLQPIYSTAWR